ncbi:MAG: class I SAM-dependent methyltransferase [Nitrosopumilaceae archaeon]
MSYDKEFWDNYAKENESRYNEEFAKFIRDLTVSLRCTSVLEIGCGTGIDLRLFPESIDVHGVDLNELALDLAKKENPRFNFKKDSITSLPFDDSSIDIIFTHKFLNCLGDEDLKKGVSEMYRVAAKYIVNCETYDKSESDTGNRFKGRNMLKRWSDYKVKIISDVDMHEDIEPEKIRFTLVKKLKTSRLDLLE